MTEREIEVKEQLEKEGYSYKEVKTKTVGGKTQYVYEVDPKAFTFINKDSKVRELLEEFFKNYSKLYSKAYFNKWYGLSRDVRKEDLYNNNTLIIAPLSMQGIRREKCKFMLPYAKKLINLNIKLDTFLKQDSYFKSIKESDVNDSEFFKKNNLKADFSDIEIETKGSNTLIKNVKVIKDGKELNFTYVLKSFADLLKKQEWKPAVKGSTLDIEKEQKENLLKHIKKTKEGKKGAVIQDLKPGVLKLVNNAEDSHFEVRTSGRGGGTFDDNSSSGIDLSIRIPNGKNEEVLLLNLKNHSTFRQDIKNEMTSFFKLNEHKNIKKFFVLGERSNLNHLKFNKESNKSVFIYNNEEYSYKGYGKFWWNKEDSFKLTLDKYFIEQILEPLSETVGIMLSKTKNDFAPSNSFKVIHVNSSVSTDGDWEKCLSDITKVYNKMKQLGMYTGRVGAILGKIRFSKLGQAKAASVETYFPY